MIKEPRSFRISYILAMAAIFMVPVFSCNPEEWGAVDCSECFIEKPAEAEINVKVSISNLNPFVPINVYLGRIEEEILILSDTVRTRTWSAVLPAGQYYTVTATYRYRANWEWVTAIDGSHLRATRVRSACDQPCWVIQGNNFNVELRY